MSHDRNDGKLQMVSILSIIISTSGMLKKELSISINPDSMDSLRNLMSSQIQVHESQI
jgi:hypothetical protein